jgi:hypothetical protein
MLLSPIGLPVVELDTPALLLDLDAFEHNVALMAKTHRSHGIAWRPHAKAYDAQSGDTRPILSPPTLKPCRPTGYA